MKRFIGKLLVILVMLTLLAAALNLSVSYFASRKKEDKIDQKTEKAYELTNVSGGIIQTIAYSLLKPMLEARIDYYIEKHGLLDYLQKAKKQKEFKNLVNFYDISNGTGKKALCGSEVLLQIYKIPDYNNVSKEQYMQKLMNFNVDSITKFKLGASKELDWGIIGMREDGERVILINRPMNNDENEAEKNINNNESYYVKLLSVETESPASVDNLMIFDDAGHGNSIPVMCGDEVEVNYTVRKYNGEPVISDQSVHFKVGDGKVPLAIELGVLKMQRDGKRTIISPPDLLTTTDDMIIGNIQYDTQSVAIINLEIVQEVHSTLK